AFYYFSFFHFYLMFLFLGCGKERTPHATQDKRKERLREAAGSGSVPGACATRLPRGKRSVATVERRVAAAAGGDRENGAGRPPRSAVYFTGRGDQLRLKPSAEVPRGNFTLEMWTKPEGGQRSPTVIAGLYDKCFYASCDRGWLLGIKPVSDQGNRDPRFFFSLKTDRAHKATTITSNAPYSPNHWHHLAITYNGLHMKLYVNGAQVAVSRDQSGEIFSPLTKKCKVLMIGGNALNHNYRGTMEHLSLWRRALTQREIIRHMKGHGHDHPDDLSQLVIHENFESTSRKWLTVKDGTFPQVVVSDRTWTGDLGGSTHTALLPPPCGQTICDNVEVVTNYMRFWSFRKPKTVRYRLVNVYDDHGRWPTVTEHQINLQHQHLNDAFRVYNITWERTVHNVYNSSLRNRLVLTNCDISKVGDEECDPECNHTYTGFDAGYCRRHTAICPRHKQGNGVCDPECNLESFYYDNGDCCNPNITDVTKTCFNRTSPHKAFMDVKELKDLLHLDGSTHLNVFFANSSDEDLAGVATWPWDKEALTHLGGIVLNPSFYGTFGHTHTMIHEIGHSLGLYHVFRGISEVESCNDACLETEPSLETGDLCVDTNPTPKYKYCRDPEPGNDTCGQRTFKHTPYRNYMSYADDACTDSFTLNQVARMHCYLDLIYQSWRPGSKPAPVPLPPRLMEQGHDSLTLEWFPAITGLYFDREVGSVCDRCTEGRVLLQYATNSSSPRPCAPSGHWSPREAEGPPDVEQVCEPSVRTWSPNSGLDSGSVGSASCPLQGCMLQLDFAYPLVPDSLTVWVTFFSPEENGLAAIHNILLLTLSGNNVSLGPQSVFCDTPLTLKLEVDEEVCGVQFFTMEQHLEIDATLMASKPGNALCEACRPLRYRLTRNPPFSHAPLGVTYTYHVLTVSRTAESEPSPPLIHQLGSPYCGDGLVQKYLGEQCDDMNFANGDGCSNQCKKEPLFNCVDEPSLCYFYDGDGVCEDFERETSVRDCGLYTPSGFLDQWATRVDVSTQHKVHCVSLIGCLIYLHQAYYAHPMVAAAVIIHLAADGTAYSDQTQANVTVQLVDTKEQIHNLGEWRLSCRNNPLVIPVSHDLSMAFYRTQAIVVSFRSSLVAISGVGLRSFQYFDPITISGCQSNEIYNPMGQSCVHYSCDAIDCQKPLVHNAVMKCSSPGYFNGVRCTVTCNRGYTLKIHRDDDIIKTQSDSTATLTCADGKWNKQVSCEPVDCGRPDKYHVHPAVFQFAEGTTYGKRCTFQCRQPAQLIGGCSTAGHGQKDHEKLEKMSKMTVNVKFACICAHKSFTRQCTEDGSWQPGVCVPVMCEPPPPVFHGSYQCTHGFQFNSECCSQPLVIRCRKDGNWTGSFQLCPQLQGQCSLPHSLGPAILISCAEGQHNIGTKCELACNDSGSSLVLLPRNMTEDDLLKDHWRNPPKVQRIVCTMGLKWYPSPDTLHCIKGCEPFMGDNYCDGVNNRAFCNYDGGDCCHSTVKTKKVIPFPMTCDTRDDCACRDPKAQENSKGLRHHTLG
uniref:Pregnancy-associated plasma protein A, pappalysin 1b n=1 Tax=Astyanax mexicanus TaxID=7994 RepID=A0A8B9H5H4_ASTMX